MNRIVTFGLAGFFSLVGICLIGGPKQAKAFHGWPLCGGWSCQGWHPWHGTQRCYSSCSGCWGCCSSASNCCAASGCSGCSGCGGCSGCSGCWGSSRCYGCSGYGACHGAIYHSCQGCYGGDCSGYYPTAVPVIVVPAEPMTPATPPADAASGKSTLRVLPSNGEEFSDLRANRTVWVGSFDADSVVVEAR